MPVLAALQKLALSADYDPVAPTWCIVNHLLLKSAGADISMGAVVAASGECGIWSYDPHSFAPMYFSTIGGGKRLEQISGYRSVGIRTDNPSKAYDFISSAIDRSVGVAVAGPEMGLCCGYESDGSQQRVFGIGCWGPAFDGEYNWAKFSEHVRNFGNNEGFWYLEQTREPAAPVEILKSILVTVIDWQLEHPASNWIKQDCYGLPALHRYLTDVADLELRSKVDSPYINCHAILFQADGRYHLGRYFQQLAEYCPVQVNRLLVEAGHLYGKTHKLLKCFMDYNILERESEDGINEAISWVQEAYYADQQILEQMKLIRSLL